MTEVRWGLLATAQIGGVVVQAARRSSRGRFVAVASRTEERARSFAAEYSLEKSKPRWPAAWSRTAPSVSSGTSVRH